MTTAQEDILDRLEQLFADEGATAYLGEPVTIADHMLQCATLAAEEGAPDALIAAALLHDIGHLTGRLGAYSPDDTMDRRHEEAGAGFLEGLFQPLVVKSIRLHVPAKRYLCAVDPDYHATLSFASQHSLVLQGGAMDAEQVRNFEQEPFHLEAVRVRLWDDAGKIAAARTAPFQDFRVVLRNALATTIELLPKRRR